MGAYAVDPPCEHVKESWFWASTAHEAMAEQEPSFELQLDSWGQPKTSDFIAVNVLFS
jgi:hypothetical protein